MVESRAHTDCSFQITASVLYLTRPVDQDSGARAPGGVAASFGRNCKAIKHDGSVEQLRRAVHRAVEIHHINVA